MKFFDVIALSQRHGFHLVDPSPFPLVSSIAALTTTTGGVMYFHGYPFGILIMYSGLCMVIFCMYTWWRDIVREGTLEGSHTSVVQVGLRWGMLLFIASEVMFFFAFFWAFFASSLAPTIQIGAVYPPKGIAVLCAWDVPLVNTLILLLSGATVTWAHHAIVAGARDQAIYGLVLTIVLAIAFTGLQVFEYVGANFRISDGIYGSTFFMATGFHGFHVFVGTCCLSVCLFRLFDYHFSREHHFGFEAAAWYWHFVDVVWLFLFVVVYWWGGL
uniref:Cytochrome c oxidase subunit 3 n=1 Tax=Haptophyceae sp. NIES-3900 TaxID=2748608 RepID=A0A7R6WDU2_9EUKA|nr:cytochrome c oxidase subunit 3 [Haptophyceae sp. NIES-3900]